ncbi:MAG TPA: ABC transporter substrate-binding protein [Gaiellaceae bacterium]|nr:ABC transporter substrate-binding protein [Gaiellaceae bacterium]
MRPTLGSAAVLVAVVAVAAGCGSNKSASGTKSGVAGAQKTVVNKAVSGTITFDGIWTGSEATDFGDVIKAFNKVYPKVKVKYNPLGNNLTTVLSTAITGGHPPDMADIAQPGYVKQLVSQGKLKPITYAKGAIGANFGKSWQQLGTFNGKLYALVFKASNKSLLWYNVPVFHQAGVTPPKTWKQLLRDATTIKASGVPPYSIGGADGWTLTDLFENIYLRTFGVAKYNALAAHKIKWTDPSVKTALLEMQKILLQPGYLAGGTSGALQYTFNDSVTNAFSNPPKAAMVFEGDFVSGVILSSTKAKPGSGFNVVPFPAITPGPDATAVEISGDLFVTFRDNPAIEAFVKFLATPQAAAAWAKHGGFATGNHNLSPSVFPDAIDRANQKAVGAAKAVVFDMSDEQPASFGSTTGQGEWGLFQKFLSNPADYTPIQIQLEKAAEAAYKKGK